MTHGPAMRINRSDRFRDFQRPESLSTRVFSSVGRESKWREESVAVFARAGPRLWRSPAAAASPNAQCQEFIWTRIVAERAAARLRHSRGPPEASARNLAVGNFAGLE